MLGYRPDVQKAHHNDGMLSEVSNLPNHSALIPNPSSSSLADFSLDLNLLLPMKVLTIGKRLVPLEQVACVEPFDPAANPEFKPEKEFKSRLVLLNRDIVLTEQSPQEFATEHELHLFTKDSVAVNQAIVFRVETFEPTEGFNPTKPYKTRLKWRNLAGNEQSKLLLTEPRRSSPSFSRARSRRVQRRSGRQSDLEEAVTGRGEWKRSAASSRTTWK
jgi:hypothetical protein